tara:strand:- start:65 stop:304 length:240 start_codon:yes stop_codon:yes gene_type:complete
LSVSHSGHAGPGVKGDITRNEFNRIAEKIGDEIRVVDANILQVLSFTCDLLPVFECNIDIKMGEMAHTSSNAGNALSCV